MMKKTGCMVKWTLMLVLLLALCGCSMDGLPVQKSDPAETAGKKQDAPPAEESRESAPESNPAQPESPLLTGWLNNVSVVAGGISTAAIKTDGTVVNTRYDTSDWSDIIALDAGSHIVGLKTDGTVVAVGRTEWSYGSLDVEDWTDIVSVWAGMNVTVGLKADGTAVMTGNQTGTDSLSEWSGLVKVCFGDYFIAGLCADGTVRTSRYVIDDDHKDYGQFDADSWTDIIDLATGYYHTVGLRGDGTVLAVGMNSRGQCEVSEWTDIVAIGAGEYFTAGLRADGTVLIAGFDGEGIKKARDWTNVVAMDANGHVVGLLADGTVVDTDSDYNKMTSQWTDIRRP